MEEKRHVLIIEDDPLVRRMFGGLLTKFGVEALYAQNGAEGWDTARKMQPDLILLDYRMPEMDGLETATRIKGEETTRHIPIIFLTNEDLSPEAQQSLKEVGVEEYIHKSEDPDKISEVVQKYLRIR
jgi:CheY-like chemotaxis protein